MIEQTLTVVTAKSVLAQLKILELQVTALKKQMLVIVEQNEPSGYTVADLLGKLEGKVSTSEEEIDTVLYRTPPEYDENTLHGDAGQ